jgi:hypothetical protein
MDKQSFYDNQLVTNADLNTALSNAEAGEKLTAKEGIGFGVTRGLLITPVAGQMQITMSPGVAIDKAGLACSSAQITAQSCVTDFYSNPVAVGVGQERWVAVFAKIGRSLQGHATNSSGGVQDNTNYTQQPVILNPNGDVIAGTPKLFLVIGAAAVPGAAPRPSLDSTAVLLCDLHVVYGQTDFSALGAIDYQRREMFQRVEPPNPGLAPANGAEGFSLVSTLSRGAYTTRTYVSLASGGLFFTINAEMVPGTGASGILWRADTNQQDSLGFSLGGLGFGTQGNAYSGIVKAVVKTAGTNVSYWTTAQWTVISNGFSL